MFPWATHLVWWMDFESIPCRLAGKSKQLMCLGIQPNPNYVYRRTFCMVLLCPANILVYCPVLNSAMDRSLWEHHWLHGHQQISHESFFPDTCWGPKSIPFGVFPCFRPGFHFHRPVFEKTINTNYNTGLSYKKHCLFTTYLWFITHFECYNWFTLPQILSIYCTTDLLCRCYSNILARNNFFVGK